MHSANAQSDLDKLPAGSGRRHMPCMPARLRRSAVNLKTALLAVTAVVALLGAAIVGVPSTSDKVSEPIHKTRPAE
jgi:hypothetical protein